MNYRTDLALERIDFEKIKKEEKGYVEKKDSYENMSITTIDIKSEAFAKKIGKALGTYITIEVPSFSEWVLTDDNYIGKIGEHIRTLIPEEKAPVLVVGLGNTEITPDALGPKTADKVLPTRHLTKEIIKASGLGPLKSVAVFTTNVLGKTGVESAETVKSLCEFLKPSALIVIDALAAAEVKRLGSTIQISNTGIAPGAGVGNHRKLLNEETVGCPVIAVGIPTVVDAFTLTNAVTGQTGNSDFPHKTVENMMVTPREIDLMIDRAATVLSLSINNALQPHISSEDMSYLVS